MLQLLAIWVSLVSWNWVKLSEGSKQILLASCAALMIAWKMLVQQTAACVSSSTKCLSATKRTSHFTNREWLKLSATSLLKRSSSSAAESKSGIFSISSFYKMSLTTLKWRSFKNVFRNTALQLMISSETQSLLIFYESGLVEIHSKPFPTVSLSLRSWGQWSGKITLLKMLRTMNSISHLNFI